MSTNTPATDVKRATAAPSERIDNLDSVRGLAVLGILVMNAVSLGAGSAAYFNLDTSPTSTTLDWTIGVFGEIVVDQKFMALFSLLFGAGIVLFHDRACAKGHRAGWLSLWRNFLLLLIGLMHSLVWDGDVLLVYAIAAPLLIAARHLPAIALFALGTTTLLVPPTLAVLIQPGIGVDGSALGDYWLQNGGQMSDGVAVWVLTDFLARAIGFMLIGVALYRTGFITGASASTVYRRVALFGTVIGLTLATLGVLFVTASGFAADIALIGSIPNTIGTLPAALGYLAIATLWNRRATTALHRRVRAVGKMALSNYLAQTALGIVIMRGLADPEQLTRTTIAVFVLAVWMLQLWWSSAWLARYRYGPAEWLWRCATYRRWQPLCRGPSKSASCNPVVVACLLYLVPCVVVAQSACDEGANFEAADNACLLLGGGLLGTESEYRSDDAFTGFPVVYLRYGRGYWDTTELGYYLIGEEAGSAHWGIAALLERPDDGFEAVVDEQHLNGLDDREPVFEGGIKLTGSGSWGQLELGTNIDLEGKHDSYRAYASYEFPLYMGRLRASPSVSLTYRDENNGDYYYGVDEDEPTSAARFVYVVDEPTTSLGIGYSLTYLLDKHWRLFHSFEAQLLDEALNDSPLTVNEQPGESSIGVLYRFF